MSKELVVKNTKAQKYFSLVKKGYSEEEALSKINHNRMIIIDCCTVLIGVGSSIGTFALSLTGDVFPILTIAFSFAAFFTPLLLLKAYEDKLKYSRETILSLLSPEERTEAKKVLELSDTKTNLISKYNKDPDLFVMNYFGVYNYELVLRIKSEMEKGGGADYLMEIINVDSPKHQELKSKINPANALKIGNKV